MKDSQHHDPIDALGEAYEKLYEYVADNFHRAEQNSKPLFNNLVKEARNKTVELKKLSEHDANKVVDWVKRDMTDAANYLTESGRELKDWLGFETVLVENKLLDLLKKAADQTTVKLLQINEDSHSVTTFHTGEVTGPGTIACDQCSEPLHFHRTGKIPPCPKCHATSFHRKVS